MAPPSADEVYRSVGNLIDRLAPTEGYPLFEWKFLVDHVRREFRSTTPAVARLMRDLVDDDRLSRARVSHGGYVRPPGDLDLGMLSLYFHYHSRHHEDTARDWGLVTAQRVGAIENLWANGDRYLYTTPARMRALTAFAVAERKALSERRSRKAADREARFWAAAEKADAEVRSLLDRLREEAPGLSVEHTVSSREGGDEPVLILETRSTSDLAALLAVLREGLT